MCIYIYIYIYILNDPSLGLNDRAAALDYVRAVGDDLASVPVPVPVPVCLLSTDKN